MVKYPQILLPFSRMNGRTTSHRGSDADDLVLLTQDLKRLRVNTTGKAKCQPAVPTDETLPATDAGRCFSGTPR